MMRSKTQCLLRHVLVLRAGTSISAENPKSETRISQGNQPKARMILDLGIGLIGYDTSWMNDVVTTGHKLNQLKSYSSK
jgi:hypothetical protein